MVIFRKYLRLSNLFTLVSFFFFLFQAIHHVSNCLAEGDFDKLKEIIEPAVSFFYFDCFLEHLRKFLAFLGLNLFFVWLLFFFFFCYEFMLQCFLLNSIKIHSYCSFILFSHGSRSIFNSRIDSNWWELQIFIW